MAHRISFLLNNGQSATANTVGGTIPGTAVAGDVALVEFETTQDTVTVTAVPSGWTLLSGPNTDTVGNSWLYGKELVSGDIGAAVSWTLSALARCSGHGAIYSGRSWAGRIVATPTIDTALTASIVIPTIASVPAGADFHVGATRVRGIPSTDVTPPVGGGYSQGASERSATAYGTGSDTSAEAMHKAGVTAGSYGGETATGSSTSRGTTYAVALPAASTDTNVQVATAFVGADSDQPAATASATRTVDTAFVGGDADQPSVTATASPAVGSAAVGASAGGVAPGTAVPVASAFTGAGSPDPSVTASSAPAVATSFVGASSPTSVVGASVSLDIATALVGASSRDAQAASYVRFQWWDGATWVPITPLVWDGTAWVAIPVTLLEPD